MSTLPTLFPPAREHARVKELSADTNSFVLESWPFASQAQRDFFVRCEFAAFMSKIVPDGDPERMIHACRVPGVLFMIDDAIEEQVGRPGLSNRPGLSSRIIGIIRGEMVPKAGSPVEELIHRIFREIQDTTGVEHYGQLSRLACEFYASQSEAPAWQNISEYLNFRCVHVGGYFTTALSRYALDIYLTNEELQNPLLAACERFVIDACAMENDVASYEKELQQNTVGNNLVAMLLEHGIDGRAFDTAPAVMDHIRELIADSEAKAQAALSVALADTVLGSSDSVRRWLLALPYIIGGNAWWSQQTARYNLPGKPVPRRVIHLEGVGDMVVPEP
ncbi:isoprenoid synthase domain-containing protein [Mycena vulgaris]|nr:isoprenoid synthase domain-containing protein [Mycena vulgaris]